MSVEVELARLANRMQNRNRSARNNAAKAARLDDPAAARAWDRAATAYATDRRDLQSVLRKLTPPTEETPDA